MLYNQDKTIERAKDLLFNRHILLSIFISGVLLVLVRQFWSALELKSSDIFFQMAAILRQFGQMISKYGQMKLGIPNFHNACERCLLISQTTFAISSFENRPLLVGAKMNFHVGLGFLHL